MKVSPAVVGRHINALLILQPQAAHNPVPTALIEVLLADSAPFRGGEDQGLWIGRLGTNRLQ